MSVTTTIKCSSRASVKVGESFYTVEYTEERAVDKDDNLEDERRALWETCNRETDLQIEDIFKIFRK